MENQPEAETTSREVGKWACHKLECLADYVEAYSRTIKSKTYCYLELFSGVGNYFCKGTDCHIEGSALRILKARRKFRKYIFVAKSRQDSNRLKQLIKSDTEHEIEVVVGNCNNERVLRKLLDMVPRSASTLVLIDPSGYQRLNWTTIEQLARRGLNWQDRKMELLIIFPLEMALLRNLTRPECSKSITRLYGNQKWEEIAVQKKNGQLALDEVRIELVGLFKEGLKSLGYQFVEDFKPGAPNRQPFYHLILASDNKIKMSPVKRAWGKPRYLPCELLYSVNKNI